MPNGDGYGYGSGDGSGYGYGSGSGDGSGDFWESLAKDAITDEQAAKIEAAGAKLAYWRSDAKGLPSNGGSSNVPASVGIIEEVAGPLQVCTRHALHATLAPWNYQGERCWVVALYGEVQEQGDKLGALKREILAELKPMPW